MSKTTAPYDDSGIRADANSGAAGDITDLLEQLELNVGRFQLELLTELAKRKEEATPHLLYVLEEITKQADDLEDDPDYMLHVYAMYLLAQFREKKAYPLIVDFFSLPDEQSLDLTGDVVTEDLHRILASVSGGETGLAESLIENDVVNEYVRWAAVESLVSMAVNGIKPRSEVLDILGSLVRDRLTREPNAVWEGLASAALDLDCIELYLDVAKLCDADVLDTDEIDQEDGRVEFDRLKGSALFDVQQKYRLVNDIAEEMEWMGWDQDPRRNGRRAQGNEDRPSLSMPMRERPDVQEVLWKVS
jgi:hypothetical protein